MQGGLVLVWRFFIIIKKKKKRVFVLRMKKGENGIPSLAGAGAGANSWDCAKGMTVANATTKMANTATLDISILTNLNTQSQDWPFEVSWHLINLKEMKKIESDIAEALKLETLGKFRRGLYTCT